MVWILLQKKYHSYCRIKYQTEAEGKHNQEKRMAGEGCIPVTSASIWHLNREIHKKEFEALCSYLQEVVIENKGVLMLTDVNNYYCNLLLEFQGNTLDMISTVQKLEEKSKKYYGGNKRKGNILYDSSLSLDEAVQKLDIKGDDMKTKVRDIALLLREEINRAERFPLPNNLKIEDIKRGEVTVPELVITFSENLGPDARRWESKFKKLIIKSMSEDAVFAATVGLKKPQKHLMLGITLKCLVGSRKVIEIMNRLGHCASYHTMEEVEIEGIFQSTKQNLVTPVGMKLNPC